MLEASTPRAQVNLIVIDQFEELFSQSEPSERAAVLNILAGVAPFLDLRTHIIATVRSEYLPSLLKDTRIYALLKQQRVDLRLMTGDEPRDAIQRPFEAETERLGQQKRWQPELVDRLVEDAVVDSTYLPLLQVTLESIWDRGRLTLDRYEMLTEALQEHAENAYCNRERPRRTGSWE